MSRFTPRNDAASSFLPEDYLRRKSEVRSIIFSFVLFSIVTVGLIAAFFVKIREVGAVREKQNEIVKAYLVEQTKIEELKELEKQQAEMMHKAEITTALIEKVPRSVLMAELINRMPKELTLTELNLKSRRLDAKPSKLDTKFSPNARPKSIAGGSKSTASSKKTSSKSSKTSRSSKSKAETPPPEAPKPMPPKYEFRIEIMGLAGADQEIADYHTALKQCPFLENVELVYTGDVKLDDQLLRKFRIESGIRSTVDARSIEPLQVPRLPARPGLEHNVDTSGLFEGADAANLDPTIPNNDYFTSAEEKE